MFDKSESLFPVRRNHVDLAHCSVGPMYGPAAKAAQEFIREHSERGMLLRERYGDVLRTTREKTAKLLETAPENVAFVSNTAEGTNLIANGYPFEPGDQVIGYEGEFPSDYFPWVLQGRRGVEYVLLSDKAPRDADLADTGILNRFTGWSMEELEEKTTERTRVIALSHVQFVSGYAADLERLGDFCRERGIDLVVDAAQSLGVLPVQPERYGIAAITGAAWKWMLASRGLGLFYTTPAFREKLSDTMAGDAMMTHRLDYLNRTWEPFPSARRYEYSTLPWEHLVGLETVLDEVFLRYGMQAIAREVFRLQDVMLDALDPTLFAPLRFPDRHRSGILAMRPRSDPGVIVKTLRAQGVVATTQGGYVRLAPHFYLTDDDVVKAAEALNRVG